MKALNLYQAYDTYLRAGGDVRKALEAAMVRGKLPRDVTNKLAGVHAKYYACHAHQTESGAWRFFNDAEDTTSANRHEAATKQWNRAIAPLTGQAKSTRGGARFKTEKVSPEAQRKHALAAFKLLSAADRKWFLVQIASL